VSVDSIIDDVIRREGGYVNHASDRGGPTNWGITARALGEWRGIGRAASAEEVNDLTVGEAKVIYMDRYVYRPGFDTVAALSERVGDEVIDSGVNFGPSVPSVWLQRWLNGLNRQGRDYPDLVVDGRVGPATSAALRAYLKIRGARGEAVLVAGLNGSQAARYLELVEARSPNEDFLFGWISSRVLAHA
jgi:lysozyme family protein